jgi:predicted nucleotidyltransferase
MSVETFLDHLKNWAATRDDIRALALVGSHARGQARADSDVDLVVVCSEAPRYLKDTAWVSDFGEAKSVALEDWGKVQSVRVLYRNGLEVEFGITTKDWASLPPDRGTADVLKNGVLVLLDRDGELLRLVDLVQSNRPA